MSLRTTGSPEPLPSLPGSPVEEDISGQAGQWKHEESGSGSEQRRSRNSKGKERELPVEQPYQDNVDEASDEGEVEGGADGYPPTKEEEAESRRVEENLRRWEQAERQRRRVARDSASKPSSSTSSGSIVVDVTRKASLLWTGRRSKRPSTGGGVGSHHVLQSTDDGMLPLDDIECPPSGVNSARQSLERPTGENPFLTPSQSTTSLNIPEHSPVMAESPSTSTPATASATQQLLGPNPKRSENKSRAAAAATSPSKRGLPPPKPLDLPEPRTPPPRTTTPHANRPPEPIPPPNESEGMAMTTDATDDEDVPRQTRWWTDWLCGCIESGDHQAARTNPFE